MKKQRPLVPYERPMALRRTFIAVIVVLGGFFLVRALTSEPTPLGELSPQQLATSMGAALLHVHHMTFTVASQVSNQGQTDAVGGSMSVERNGNFQISGQSEQDPALTGEIRFVDGTLYFHYSKSVIYRIMRLVPQRISNHLARVASTSLGGRWFTTGDVATSSGNAPSTPSTVRQLFSSLGITQWSTFAKQVPTTNQGVTVVPLVTDNVTWFVRATGARLPNAVTSPDAADNNPFAFLLSYANIQISYQRVAIATPAHLATVPAGFGAQWNSVLPAQRISKLNPCGLLWLALSPTS
jgi:hypothetical protein